MNQTKWINREWNYIMNIYISLLWDKVDLKVSLSELTDHDTCLPLLGIRDGS